jgi:hypothetical protein
VHQKVQGGGNIELKRRVVKRNGATVTTIRPGKPARIEISLPKLLGKIVIPPEMEAYVTSLGKPLNEYRKQNNGCRREYYQGPNQVAIVDQVCDELCLH